MSQQTRFNVIISLVFGVTVLILLLVIFNLFGRLKQAEQSAANNGQSTVLDQQLADNTQSESTATIIKTESLSVRTNGYDGDVTVSHLCDSKPSQTFEPICIGGNTLTLKLSDQPEIIIIEQKVAQEADAPILKPLVFLPGNEPTDSPPTLLISFARDTCASTGDCGVGMPEHYVTYQVDLSDASFAEVKHFPRYGKINWSPYDHKAIFIPSSCGGAGCEEEPLMGYDLATDKVYNNLTQERGADFSDAQDIMGNRLSYWSEILWDSSTQAKATLVSPDGKAKAVTINFN